MARFDTTRWSLVLRAGDDASGEAAAALDRLCRVYRAPVLTYIRRRGYAPEQAEDLTQGFFVRFVEHAVHARADPARGRFRSYLLTAVKRFLINADAAEHADKRGGHEVIESLEQVLVNGGDPASDGPTPEQAFEQAWAMAVLGAATERLREEAQAAGKLELFEQLRPFIAEPPDEAAYGRLAEALSMRRNTLAVAVHRLRQRLRDLVHAELAETTTSQVELEAEARDLRRTLGAQLQ